jgi:predicted MFS family arabinose efflux permease
VVSGGTVNPSAGKLPSIGAAMSLVLASRRGRLAIASMALSQAVMVAIMTMTPVHMKLHGHETLSQYVVSLHIAGMYAFSPLVGRHTARRGTLSSVLIGSSVLLAAAVASSLSGDGPVLIFPALWLLGVGWNFGLIGGSSMLLEAVSERDRVTVQGSADLLMSLCGGAAGLSSGFIRRAVGYHMLSVLGIALSGALLVAAWWAHSTRSVAGAPA